MVFNTIVTYKKRLPNVASIAKKNNEKMQFGESMH
jgi:hypothetical protein